MDLNDVRSAVTLVSLVMFLGLMVWTWRPARKRDHEAASMMVFDEQPGDSHDEVTREVTR